MPDTLAPRALDHLTPEQRKAVTFAGGPLLIVAGAGTGKTTVIAERIAYLVQSGKATPSEVLALTFTDKASQEMSDRVAELLGQGFVDVTVCTFHSFGDRILRQFALECGLPADYDMLDDTGQLLFLRDHLFELPLQQLRPLGQPTSHLRALRRHFGRLKDECLEPSAYLQWAQAAVARAADPGERERAELQLELAECYGAYQDLLTRAGLCDFADLVFRPLQLLRHKPGVVQRLAQQYRFVLVDEFQDTNGGQFELVRLLAASHRNLTVVGDDDQSIYAFRGAAIGNILQFSEHYPEALQVVLTQNFRSLQPILDSAYGLIRGNNPDRLEIRNGLDKQLRAARRDLLPLPGLEPIAVQRFATVSDEAQAVADKIEALRAAGLSAGGCALLVRNNRDAVPFLHALNDRGIPCRFDGSQGLYKREEVRIAISFVRVLTDPNDNQSLFYLLSSKFYECPARDLTSLNSRSVREHVSLLTVLERGLQEEWWSPEQAAPFQRFADDYNTLLARLPYTRPGTMLYEFLQRSPWWHELAANRLPNAQAMVHNLSRFFDVMHRFTQAHEDATLCEFAQHLTLLMESGDSPPTVESDALQESVQLLTVHRSKGLEFPAVFLVGLNHDQFPNRFRSEELEFPWALLGDTAAAPSESSHLQEERRLFYVALTRASRHLWLSGSDDTGGRRKNRPSRFVREAIGAERAAAASPPRIQSLQRIEKFAQSSPALPAAAPRPLQELTQGRISDYLDCPHRYFLAHVVRVPTTESQPQEYGTALHGCLSWYLNERRAGEAPSLERLHQQFRSLWRRVGCVSGAHAEARLEQGLKTLTRFHTAESAETQVAQAVEQEFKVTLDGVRILGRIDRVDHLPDGRVVITDYKTSDVRDQERADEQARDSLQLTVYGVAYEMLHGRPPDELRLHFVESGLVGRSLLAERFTKAHTEKIREVIRGVNDGQFPARPSMYRCRGCAYQTICNAAPK